MVRKKFKSRVRDEDRYTIADEEIIAKHLTKMTELLREEQEAEGEKFQSEVSDKKAEDREREGKALLYLALLEQRFTPAGQKLLAFAYSNGRFLPRYSLDVGNVVSLSAPGLAYHERITGTVYEKDRKQIVVAFGPKLPGWVGREKAYHLNQEASKTTYDRMLEAVRDVGNAKHGTTARLRDISLGLKKPAFRDAVTDQTLHYLNPGLNETQRKAVRGAFEAEDVFLIHGPPGTGKTVVLLEIIRQARRLGESILVSAPSNAACDHLVSSLVFAGEPVTRFGHPARMTESLREHTFNYKIVRHTLAKQLEKNAGEIERLFKQNDRRRERGANSWDDEKAVREEVNRLRDDNRALKSEIFHQVWKESDIVVCTHTVAGDPLITSRSFDWIILDEAGQSTEPASWIPIRRGGKVVMAGDHCQLPPTVHSKRKGPDSLMVTLFERFHEKLDEKSKVRLDVQYRMNEAIMQFSSQEFYEGQLLAAKENQKHTLSDLAGVHGSEETQTPFAFFDTAGLGFEEREEEGTGSRFNEEEAQLVVKLYRSLTQAGLAAYQVGIVSPYKAQVKLLNQLIAGTREDPEAKDLPEIDSVDSFQGREKEAIIVSLVRANLKGEIGFLNDTRRMNVAMTRARRKLIVVGDSATISALPFFEDFIRYAESIKAYRSAWELQ